MITGERLYLIKQEAELYNKLEDFLECMSSTKDNVKELTEIWEQISNFKKGV